MNLGNQTLLVVDDSEINRDFLTRRLKRRGYNTEIACDGRQALDMIEKQPFDLVLLDIMMPEINGLEVLQRVREKHTLLDLPIIMVTAVDHTEDIVGALKLGANDYITKPVDFPVVLARVKTHLYLRKLNEIKNEFLGIASHDLKKPLALIQEIALSLQEDYLVGSVVDQDLHEILDLIITSSTNMQYLIGDYLDMLAMEDGKLKLNLVDININQIVQATLSKNLEYAKSKNIDLLLLLDEDLTTVSVDQRRIEQVIENFVNNAIKYSPEHLQVSLVTKQQNDSIRFEVIDQGPGFRQEDINKLFSKYPNIDNKPTGGESSTGLGLFFCRRLIDLHHGKIGVQNNSDKGATFWFEIPFEQFERSANPSL